MNYKTFEFISFTHLRFPSEYRPNPNMSKECFDLGNSKHATQQTDLSEIGLKEVHDVIKIQAPPFLSIYSQN